MYRTFWNVVFKLCDDQNLKFEPKTINLDFELGMVNLLREEFREVEIKGCRFHLGQAQLHRTTKINLVKLVNGYPIFLDFPFLPPDETEDSFVEKMIPETPTNERCTKFSWLFIRNLCGQKLKISSYNVGFKTLQYS